mmetsp:Transcript_20517/g.23689  ORF Transcript_20517/g.23689 Transcript_20517/m.23689 type:complete len:120 (-) Transcript_20517:497-856(-)
MRRVLELHEELPFAAGVLPVVQQLTDGDRSEGLTSQTRCSSRWSSYFCSFWTTRLLWFVFTNDPVLRFWFLLTVRVEVSSTPASLHAKDFGIAESTQAGVSAWTAPLVFRCLLSEMLDL